MSGDDLVDELFPGLTAAFRSAVISRRLDQGTACAAWTVREMVAHNAANAAITLIRPTFGTETPGHTYSSYDRSGRSPSRSIRP